MLVDTKKGVTKPVSLGRPRKRSRESELFSASLNIFFWT